MSDSQIQEHISASSSWSSTAQILPDQTTCILRHSHRLTKLFRTLGVASNGSESLMEILKSITKELLVFGGSLPRRYATPFPVSEHLTWIIATEKFFCRSWFRRLWVVQEMVLAKRIIVICGGRSINFESLSSFRQRCATSPGARKAILANSETPGLLLHALHGLDILCYMRYSSTQLTRWNVTSLIGTAR